MGDKYGFTTTILHNDRRKSIEQGSLHKPVHTSVAFGYGDARQLAQLAAVQHPVRHGDAQHRRMALDVPAVLQAQRAEVVVRELTGQMAFELVAELGRAGVDELSVEIGIGVHGVGWTRPGFSRGPPRVRDTAAGPGLAGSLHSMNALYI